MAAVEQPADADRAAKLKQISALKQQAERLRSEEKLVDAADTLFAIGNVLYGLRDMPAARKHYENALAIYRAKLPNDDPRIATSLNNLGIVLRDLGDLAAARKRLEEGTFVFPTPDQQRVRVGEHGLVIRPAELAMLLDGIDLGNIKRRKRYQRPQPTPR